MARLNLHEKAGNFACKPHVFLPRMLFTRAICSLPVVYLKLQAFLPAET